MSEGAKRSASVAAKRLRAIRLRARVQLIGRALGFMELARDLLEGARNLGEPVPHEITDAFVDLEWAILALKATGKSA